MKRASLVFRRSTFAIYLLLYPLPWLARGIPPWGGIAFITGVIVFLTLPLLPGKLSPAIEIRAFAYAAIGAALIPFQGYWGVFFISAAATCGAITRRPRSLTLLGAILAAYILIAWAVREEVIGGLITLIVAVGTFVTMRLSMDLHRQNEALSAAQNEIRALTLIAERERFARDLHDTLGHSLTLIALKSELAQRHLPHAPEMADKEIAEIGLKARQALAETRLAVTAMRVTGLAQELSAGVDALTKAGIRTEISGESALMPARSEGVLAMALRESLTNILRHAKAASCQIRFQNPPSGPAQLEVSDYHARDSASENVLSFREGNGISGIRARLAEIDGTLSILHRPDGTTLVITLGDAS